MNEIFNQILTIIIPVIVAIAGYIIAKIDNKKVSERLTTFEEALENDDRIYYIICPKCGAKIILSKVKIHTEKAENKNVN